MGTDLAKTSETMRSLDIARVNGDVDALMEWRRRAEVAQLYATRHDAKDKADDAGEIKVYAERYLGQLDAEAHPHGVKDEFKSSGGTELTVDHTTRAAWRRLGKLSDETFIDYVGLARKDEEAGVSTAQIVRIARLGGAVSSTTFECYTPAQYVEAAREVMGGIDLDPASSEEANKTIRAEAIYTVDDDGLDHEWQGRVWLNPPYGRSLTSSFVAKLLKEYGASRVAQGTVVINAYGFDAAWFQPLWDHVLCFTDHRIKFYGGGPTFGSLFVYLGPNEERFAEVFSQFGRVVKAWP